MFALNYALESHVKIWGEIGRQCWKMPLQVERLRNRVPTEMTKDRLIGPHRVVTKAMIFAPQ
jgi:hypothetical protein